MQNTPCNVSLPLMEKVVRILVKIDTWVAYMNDLFWPINKTHSVPIPRADHARRSCSVTLLVYEACACCKCSRAAAVVLSPAFRLSTLGNI